MLFQGREEVGKYTHVCTSFDLLLPHPIHVYYFLMYDIIPPFPDLISHF